MLTVFRILLAVLAVAVIVIVAVQPSKGEGLGSIGGGGTMFFAKNKGLDKMMEKATAWLGGSLVVLAILVSVFER